MPKALMSRPSEDLDCDAFNAAFHELGLRWHWDSETYRQLQLQIADEPGRIRHYLQDRQPHLLRAYDAAFLADVIQQKKAAHRQRLAASSGSGPRRFDWAQTLDGELGA